MNNKLKEAFRFCIVGGIATVVHYGLYWLLMQYINVNVAYAVGYILSFILNFYLTAIFTFKVAPSIKNALGMGGAHLVNFLLHMGLLNLFLCLGVAEKWAPIPVYAIAIPVNFLLVRFVFKKSDKTE